MFQYTALKEEAKLFLHFCPPSLKLKRATAQVVQWLSVELLLPPVSQNNFILRNYFTHNCSVVQAHLARFSSPFSLLSALAGPDFLHETVTTLWLSDSNALKSAFCCVLYIRRISTVWAIIYHQSQTCYTSCCLCTIGLLYSTCLGITLLPVKAAHNSAIIMGLCNALMMDEPLL